MNITEFKKVTSDIKLSKEFTSVINKNCDQIVLSIPENASIENLKTLFTKVDAVLVGLKTAKVSVNKKGLVQTKNIPKLIDMFFEYLNEGNVYYREQTVINDIVKYLNGHLSPLVENSYVDKKIFKRILYNIKDTKIDLEHEFSYEENHFFISINLKFTYKLEDGKQEKFYLKFYKKILLNEKFEDSKWLFSFWTLNDFVDTLKSCIKWLHTKYGK